uniref:Uncharacterized protein n=1 Tax=Arundo donax TaxID=35708 RepID=A0A0A9GTC7_ARUDO
MKSLTISLCSLKECLSMTDKFPLKWEVGEPTKTILPIHALTFILHNLL